MVGTELKTQLLRRRACLCRVCHRLATPNRFQVLGARSRKIGIVCVNSDANRAATNGRRRREQFCCLKLGRLLIECALIFGVLVAELVDERVERVDLTLLVFAEFVGLQAGDGRECENARARKRQTLLICAVVCEKKSFCARCISFS